MEVHIDVIAKVNPHTAKLSFVYKRDNMGRDRK